nr:PREDICTED: sodium-coupled monocarboxylate transporter 2-like isoform X2 [Bemisia tabaci]
MMDPPDTSSLSWLSGTAFFILIMATMATVLSWIGRTKEQQTVNQYLFGGKKMSTSPIAVSFIASAVSSLQILEIPMEVYLHGTTQLLGALISLYIAIIVVIRFILPQIHNQQYNSLFEFLQIRFSKNTRAIIAAAFVLKTVLYIPFVIAIPVARFSRIAAVSPKPVLILLNGLWTFNLVLSGFQSIVWCQCLSMMSIVVGLAFAIFIGWHSVGGFNEVLEIASSGGRLEIFDINPSSFAWSTFWTTIIGMSASWLYYLGANPGSYQKLISIRKEKNAAEALVWFGVGLTFVKLLMVFLGLTLYAEFSGCDPLSNKEVSKAFLVLHYIWKISNERYNYLALIFMIDSMCVAYSFMSSNLNTVSGIIYEDFVKRSYLKEPTEQQATTCIRKITFLVGALVTLLSLFYNDLDPVLSQATITGSWLLARACATALIVYCVLWSLESGDIQFSTKPMSTVGCPGNIQKNPLMKQVVEGGAKPHLLHGSSEDIQPTSHVPRLSRWSLSHYTAIGALVSLVVATLYGDVIYAAGPEQDTDNIVKVVVPTSQFKHKNAAGTTHSIASKPNALLDKEIGMTSIKCEQQVPEVHEPMKGRRGESKKM